jgi:hypothetical protein
MARRRCPSLAVGHAAIVVGLHARSERSRTSFGVDPATGERDGKSPRKNAMKRTIVLESVALLVVGALGLWGGLSSYLKMGVLTQSSSMKPGVYVFIISGALIATAVAYAFFGLRRHGEEDEEADEPEQGEPRSQANRLVFLVFAAVALYAFLIPWIGYVPSTVIFLFIQFYLLGVVPWWRTAILSIGVTASFFLVFIHYGEMIFPRGSLFD